MRCSSLLRVIPLLAATALVVAACELPVGGSDAEACRANGGGCSWDEDRDRCDCPSGTSPDAGGPPAPSPDAAMETGAGAGGAREAGAADAARPTPPAG